MHGLTNLKIYRSGIVFKIHEETVARLVEALRYKPESHGFESRWCHWNFLLT